MKPHRRTTILTLVLIMLIGSLLPERAFAYRIIYKEQLYRLYHQHLYQYPERIAENIHWLEQALRADFVNPLNALAVIRTETEWERYRHLFTLHLNLKLIEQYLAWGNRFNKREAYFFNAPFRRQNLESLETAETLFRYALVYWEEALEQVAIIDNLPRWIHLEEIQRWEDDYHRIATGDLDYGAIIGRHLDRLERVRADFEAMDETTY
ncbi:hypothetical protein [Spirochaeta africana]|uniref:Uncharacterized protein n=1 Tax=Spirochaeta africana (strain ATCC 700263 / DSM 8902 / Z-7692) TaxID=889378 RepID=H9UJB5_SPIAZ|nr:hypothetical protein [Spirochaeta africana]AFG37608.1 hypothetical protein Spiaf_1549 [Spirochaeta africana DSM 8902]